MDSEEAESAEVESGSDPVRTYSESDTCQLSCNLVALTTKVHTGEFSRRFDVALVCELHRHLFNGVRDHAGRHRAQGFGTERLIYCDRRSPSRGEVPALLERMMRQLEDYVESCLSNPEDATYAESAIKIACWAHAKLIEIQPFEDGNKRISRLLIGVVLVRLGFPPVPLEIPHGEYLAALLSYWAGDKQPFEDIITLLLAEQS